jgi:hypothetical protein
MASRARRTVDRFFVMLDSEGVELFQWLFYVIIAGDGAQNLFIAHRPPLTLQGSMGQPFFECWCVLEIIAPVLCLIGRSIYRTSFRKAANRFQLAGDLILGASESAYVIATFHIEPIGKGGHGGYLGLAFMLSAFLLAVRDFRRMRMEEREQ